MSEFEILLLAVWAIYLLDGSRWSRRESTTVSGLPGLIPYLHRARFHWAWPSPWFWRAAVEEPTISPGSTGLSERPPRSLLDRRPPAGVFRTHTWPASPAAAPVRPAPLFPVSDKWIQHLAALPGAAARRRELERTVRLWLSPASWRRRHAVVLRATRAAACWHALALLAFGALSVVLVSHRFGLSDATAEQWARWLLPLATTGTVAYVAGVIDGALAAHRLRRWLPARTPLALTLSALYPPQGLRWRLRLTERALPAAPPLTVLLATQPETARKEALRLATVLWREDSQTCADRDDPFQEFSHLLVQRATALAADCGLTAATLETPPRPDSRTSLAYCPACHAQFVSLQGRCTCAIPLRPFPASPPETPLPSAQP